jgi:hypothetical protein
VFKAGIYAPYTKSEATLAAVQIADWFVRCGVDVSFLSSGKIQTGVHPHWDYRVLSPSNNNTYKWAYKSSHFCWFEPNLSAWHMSRLVSFEGKKHSVSHFFFPGFCRWKSDGDYFLNFTDKTICLSQDAFIWLKDFKDFPKSFSKKTWANLVSPSKILAAKYGHAQKDTTRLLVFCTKEWEIDLPPDFLMLLDELLSFNGKAHITIVFEKSIATRHRKVLQSFKKRHGERFEWKTRLMLFDLVSEARKHDWVYVASTRYTYGSLLSLFASSSIPLICHDIPPVGAHITDKFNGRLIPCEILKASVPIAEVLLQDIGDILFEAADLPHVSLKSLQLSGRKLYQKKQDSFQNFVQEELVGCETSQT